jgi:hypothetical protein
MTVLSTVVGWVTRFPPMLCKTNDPVVGNELPTLRSDE